MCVLQSSNIAFTLPLQSNASFLHLFIILVQTKRKPKSPSDVFSQVLQFSVTQCEMFETSWNANAKYKWKWLRWPNRSMASSLYVFACLKWVNTSQRLTVYPWIRLNRATHFAHTSSNVCGSDICHFIYSKDEFPKFIEFSCIIYYSRKQFSLYKGNPMKRQRNNFLMHLSIISFVIFFLPK